MNLLRAASTISLLTLASRISGLFRDQLYAANFGAGAWMDAYNIAFRIPNLLRRLFGEGAFSQAFVPILAETRTKQGDEVTHQLIDAVATVLVWVLLATCIVGVAAAPLLVLAIGSGLQEFDGAVVMTRWMFPYIGFMSLVAMASGVLNTWRRFAIPAATPVLLNVAMIAAAWWLAPQFAKHGLQPIYSLAIGVLLGGLLQLGMQIPALSSIGCLPRIDWHFAAFRAACAHPGVRRVMHQMGPALLGVSVAQLSLLINSQIASHVGVGAVSWLTYADRLMEFPTSLLGVALGVVLLPQLSALRAKEDAHAYSDLLDWGLRLVVLLSVPCAVALMVFPEPLVAVLFHYGAFRQHDALQTTHALMGYGVGLLGLVAVKVLAPGFYAHQNTRTPAKIGVVVLVFTQILNLGFVRWFGHAGLALSIGCGALLNAGLLLYGLRARGTYTPAQGWFAFIVRVAVASLLMALLLAWCSQALDWFGLQAHAVQRAGWLALALSVAGAIYFSALAALGMRPADFRRRG